MASEVPAIVCLEMVRDVCSQIKAVPSVWAGVGDDDRITVAWLAVSTHRRAGKATQSRAGSVVQCRWLGIRMHSVCMFINGP